MDMTTEANTRGNHGLANLPDRILIAHALAIAGELQPTDTARHALVEMSKRMHLKILEIANGKGHPTHDEIMAHAIVALAIGLTVGGAITAWLLRL